jgi:hypothetical protein
MAYSSPASPDPWSRPGSGLAAAARRDIDFGQNKMLRVYNLMLAGLGFAGVVGHRAVKPLIWVVTLAAMGAALLLSIRIARIGDWPAQATFWGYSALIMGLSLGGILLDYTSGVGCSALIFAISLISLLLISGLSAYHTQQRGASIRSSCGTRRDIEGIMALDDRMIADIGRARRNYVCCSIREIGESQRRQHR